MIQTITANKATPSTNAAITIMLLRISLVDSGWRAMASIAEEPILPIPIPAPIAAMAAPIQAPNLARPTPAAACNKIIPNIVLLFKSYTFLLSCFFLMLFYLCQSDKQGRKHGKYICLNKRYQCIYKHHKKRKQYRDHSRPA